MISGPFLELYVTARLHDIEFRRGRGDPTRHRGPSLVKQRLARALVRLAVEIGGDQVQLERPIASA